VGKTADDKAGARAFYATNDGRPPGTGNEVAGVVAEMMWGGSVFGDLIAKTDRPMPSGLPKVVAGLDPMHDDEITRKKYVDDQVATRMPANTLILLSPNGHRWQAAIADDGTLSWTDLGV
jgi:hypothetical protein